MNDLNSIFFLGNLAKDPELRYTEEGAAYAEMVIAVNKYWRDKDGQDKNSVDYINLTCWNSLARNCANSLRKGCRIMASGSIRFGKQQKDGKKSSKMFLTANAVAASLEFNEVSMI